MDTSDFIIVGGGLAGLGFARFCELNGKSFVLFEDKSRSSSMVAGGMFNPVVLKRFTSIWKSAEQLDLAFPFYKRLEADLQSDFFYELPLHRKLYSVEEQNNWFAATDHPNLQPFLSDKISYDPVDGISNEFGFGEVYQCGFLDVQKFVLDYRNHLHNLNLLQYQTFDVNQVHFSQDKIHYDSLKAKHLIFADGFSLHHHRFFEQLPLDGTKGELLIVRIPELKLHSILKSDIFVIPFKEDLYKVGATYNWSDKTDATTQSAKDELVGSLKKLISCSFEVVDHLAGVRPTVKDRRPLVGTHYEYKNVHLLNGLGTRGVMLGPFLAKSLFDHLIHDAPLDKEIDIHRYYKKLQLIK